MYFPIQQQPRLSDRRLPSYLSSPAENTFSPCKHRAQPTDSLRKKAFQAAAAQQDLHYLPQRPPSLNYGRTAPSHFPTVPLPFPADASQDSNLQRSYRNSRAVPFFLSRLLR